jgi:hypothetical protein
MGFKSQIPNPKYQIQMTKTISFGILVIRIYLMLSVWNLVLHHSLWTASLNTLPLSL